jgi:uncharacterized protein (UPF0335 family)
VFHVQELERLVELREMAADDLREGFAKAQSEGYDTTTLKVVLKLRRMTPSQRQERRALEAIYLAALGMLEGDPLPEEARRRLDGSPAPDLKASRPDDAEQPADQAPDTAAPPTPEPEQPPLIVKDPAEAKSEGAEAAAAGKRIYDNPYPAGDPCRAAWDEGWCSHTKSHGMDTPSAFQRRTDKTSKKDDSGDGDVEKRGAA